MDTQTINPAAESTRERYRGKDGRFGEQHLQELAGGTTGNLPGFATPAADSDLPCGRWNAIPTRDRAERMVEDLHDAVTQVVREDNLGRWMDSIRANGVRQLSFGNRALVAMQLNQRGIDPSQAGQVRLMGLRQWESLDRRVKKGAKAIYYLVPIHEAQRDDRGRPVLDEHGQPRTNTRLKAQAIYNITDTEGAPLPEPPTPGTVGELRPGVITGLRDRIAAAGYAYSERPIAADPHRGQGTLGYTSPEGYVVVDDRLPDTLKADTLAHELAHIQCGHLGQITQYRQHTGRMETEAKVTAYLVSRELGMGEADAEEFRGAYVNSWAQSDPQAILAAMSTSMNAYQQIVDGPWPEADTDEARRLPS